MLDFGIQARRQSVAVQVGNVTVGGGAPVVVQSMTNTDTRTSIPRSARWRAGQCRFRDRPHHGRPRRGGGRGSKIKERLLKIGCQVPIVGDFHYIGHKLLATIRAAPRRSTSTASIPAMSGFKTRRTGSFRHQSRWRSSTTSRCASAPTGLARSGLLTHLMDENSKSNQPKEAREITREAMVQSALLSAARAEEIGLPRNRIILSAKVSSVQDLVLVYAISPSARTTPSPGAHRSRHGQQGHRRFVVGARHPACSRHRRHHPRVADAGARRRPHVEVKVAQEILQTMGFRTFVPLGRGVSGLRPHHLDHVPGTGRLDPVVHPRLDAGVEEKYPGVEGLNVAVNGLHRQRPGESKHADIGISLPGTARRRPLQCLSTARKPDAARRDRVAGFPKLVIDYIDRRFGVAARDRPRRVEQVSPLVFRMRCSA